MSALQSRRRADDWQDGCDLVGLEQELYRLEAELEAEVDEREGELAAAIEGLTELSGLVGGAARLPLEVSSRRIQELIEEVRRLKGLLADLHEESDLPHIARAHRSARAFREPRTQSVLPARILAVALACLLVGGAVLVASAFEQSSSAKRQPAPASPAGTTSLLFARSPVALLSGLPGNYAFDGGTPLQQAQVTAALAASGFDWYLIPQTITVHMSRTPRRRPRPATSGSAPIS